MSNLEAVLKDKYNIDTSVEYGVIGGDNGFIKVQITPPSGDSHPYRTTWRLRMHPSASFENWGCHPIAICEEFSNEGLMIEYLSDVGAVYNVLFSHLTDSYKTVARMLRNTHRF